MSRSNTLLLAVIFARICLSPGEAAAQSRSPKGPAEQWVTTWATALQLVAGDFPGTGGRRGGGAPANSRPQAARSGPLTSNLPPTFEDQTLRMIVRGSVGGRRVRIELSNMLNAQAVEIGAAHIGLHKAGGAIVEGSDRVLTFGGGGSFTLQPGVLAISDPVDLNVPPSSDLAVSLYLPHDTGAPTSHVLGLHSGYIAKGNVAGSTEMANADITFAYAWLSSVDVLAPPDAFTVVAFGDSITDGYGTTRDSDKAWPTLLARRLNRNPATQHVAVVNQGLSGNQVLRDGAGMGALVRVDRDVLGHPGVKWVILLEGINDINNRGRVEGPNAVTADDLIWGYRQIIERCHAHGVKVMGATIMPEEGVPTASERGESIRQTVNQWIRAKGNFDAVVDFDAVVRDPQHPVKIRAEFDPGDHIHPNDVANQAMADAFDLKLFR